MPLHFLIVGAVLAAAAASFAEEATPSDGVAPLPVAAPAAVVPPRIIEVAPADIAAPFVPARDTADRDMLLREFPDALVESLWIQDWQDLERAYQFGRLVDVPSDPLGRGIELRLEGTSRIGELEDDSYYQTLLCRLAPAAAGLLYRIASRLRVMEGEEYEPLQITSLVRTWDYQIRLTDVNPNADRTRDGVPPTHVLGMAFDISRSQMSAARQERLEFLFDQLAHDGELAYYKEGSRNGMRHYHVIALPSAEYALVRDFERESRPVERDGRDDGEVPGRYALPDAPCVTFGGSLEPFSSICSCEMTVEASAALSAGVAPVSH